MDALRKLLAAYHASDSTNGAAADATANPAADPANPANPARGDAAAIPNIPTAQLRELVDQAIRTLGAPATLTPHTLLADRYELHEAIGRGGTGQVWRARDRKFDRFVAVKVLTPLASATLDVDRIVEREGRLLAKLDHPGAVRVQDSGRDGEHRFLVMDLIGGIGLDAAITALAERRKTSPSPLRGADLLSLCGNEATDRAVVRASDPWPTTAVRFAIELLRILEAAHRVDVVHRDLKPANLRVVGGARPVVLDWGHGLTCDHVPGSLTAHLFGTAAYSAPEQWGRSEEIGPRTDVYQVGVVLCELLTLQRCFPDDTAAETMRRVREGDFRRPRAVAADVPAEVEACVLRAMDVEPARRYGSAAEFRADLERWVDGERPEAARLLPQAASTVRGFLRRRRVPVALGVALLLGAALAWSWSSLSVTAVAEDGVLRVELDGPAVMVAFRLRAERDGVLCSPVRLANRSANGAAGAGSGLRSAMSCELTAGRSEVEVREIGDEPPAEGSFVQAVFADRGDPEALRKLERFAELLEQAGRLVDRRRGVWLPRGELEAMLGTGRGGGGAVDVPIAAMVAPERWQQGGLQGLVIPWTAKQAR
ncbi:MAG: serine/threonine-protein kinase [Planctomycetota bacterium]